MSRAQPPPGAYPGGYRGGAPPQGQQYGRGPFDGGRTPDQRGSPRVGEKPPPPPGQYGAGNARDGGRARAVRLTIGKVADKNLQTRLIYRNECAVSPDDFPPPSDGSSLYILLRCGVPLGEYVVTAVPVPGFPRGTISLSDPQRTWCRVSLMDELSGEIYHPFQEGKKAYLGSLDMDVSFPKKTSTKETFKADELAAEFRKTFRNQLVSPGQRFLLPIRNVTLLLVPTSVGLVQLGMASEEADATTSTDPQCRGILVEETNVNMFKAPDSDVDLKSDGKGANINPILAKNFNFEDLGIGGLDDQFANISRRAFSSRLFSPELIDKMGVKHVKGLLLFGPPGTGKTLIARQIGKALNARPPKIVNGPEVLNKYVGASEENIRKLFAEAEAEYKEKGDHSGLHIIIFDELDAVCKQRGSGAGGGTGVGDSVVNQLLSKLDGVEQLNNILLIGMTNRKDMIDDALLRPGRLEILIEIPLPDEAGRRAIFVIHTKKMLTSGLLDPAIDLDQLAAVTKNYSGAEIEGVVRAATSYAFSRHTEVGKEMKVKADIDSLQVSREDFIAALNEVKPAYGVSETDLENAIRGGIIMYSPHVDAAIKNGMSFVNTIQADDVIGKMAVLFHGPPGSGKTAIASYIAKQSGFPFIKMISPQHLTAFRDEFERKDYLTKVFNDAFRTPLSIVILDDFEKLIEWNPIGPRFSNTVLDRLMAFNHRIMVFATTSQRHVLKELGVLTDFRRQIKVPGVANTDDLASLLSEKGGFSSADIAYIKQTLADDTGSHQINVGVKVVLEIIEESRVAAAHDQISMVESFLARMRDTMISD
ncbi:hypothetical protein ACHAQA_003525 [Verticillium albo-atrum]